MQNWYHLRSTKMHEKQYALTSTRGRNYLKPLPTLKIRQLLSRLYKSWRQFRATMKGANPLGLS